MRVLVTGGSGFLGTRLKNKKPEWHYISSKQYDLTDPKQVKCMLFDYTPDAIVHLAARVGGIKDNSENQADFYHINTMINTNILQQSHNFGIQRILSSLSTCAFPDKVENYPFYEKDLFLGSPAKTNFSYGMTKRMLQVGSVSYRKQYNRNYSTFCPSNIYGPSDHFDSENSHFVASLISKVANAKNGDTLYFWGTGKPMRQQLYVDDLCDMIPMLLKRHNTDCPLIVAPDENLTIKQMVDTMVKYSGKDIKVIFDGKLDGQFRKDGSNEKLKDILPNYRFTNFYDGIINTYEWYLENK